MGANGGVDVRELQRLRRNLEMMNEQMDIFFEASAKVLAARLLAKVIKRTPVGKMPEFSGGKTVKVKGGKGRSRTFLTAEGVRFQRYWSGYQGGTLRRGWTGGQGATMYANSLRINHVGDIYSIEIVNPMEYASYVEFGHRQRPGRYVPALGKKLKKAWVPGKFMLTISEQEIEAAAPAILERKLKKLLGECFK